MTVLQSVKIAIALQARSCFRRMKITLLLLANIFLKLFYPALFLLAPFFLIYFLKQHKHFFIYLIAGSLLEDWLTLKPFSFTLFIVSATFLFLWWLNRFVSSEKFFGALLFLFIFLLIYFGALGLLFQNNNLNYLTYIFLLNFIYGSLIVMVYKIIT